MDEVMRHFDYPSVIETIKGKIYKMARPALNHIEAGARLTWLLMNYFNGKECKFLPEPTVELGENQVVPDICIVCDKSKLKKTRIVGAPDLVIEVKP